MRPSEFTFDLPEDLIAQYPSPERTESRLLVLNRQTGACTDHRFFEITDFLEPGDLLVMNNTRVIPARLYARKETGGKLEILIERLRGKYHALAQIRASKSPKPGTRIHYDRGFSATVEQRQADLFLLCFDQPVKAVMEAIGHIPLPPYIAREDTEVDVDRYQTVFAEKEGAVAAPTAGLHFDQALLDKLQEKGIEFGRVTLHVGAGTFQPVRVERVEDHKMHAERIEVSAELCEQVKKTRSLGGRVIALGTTSVRALETASCNGEIQPYTGETDIFICPGYTFRCIDALITNFHLPESTLLMLVCAFAGKEKVLKAYRHAVEEKYRFFSYGDAMFIS